MENTNTRFTIRDLPLPAKLVVTVFLMAVGLGYCWAMMQLHFKHAAKGNLFPGGTDVVERFSGQSPPWEKQDPPEQKPEEKKDADIKAAPVKLVAGAKIKSIIDARCTVCHAPDAADKPEIPFINWDAIAKHLDPAPDKGTFHKVISKEDDSTWGKDNMTQAFTKKSRETMDGEEELEWKQQIKKRPEADLRAEREIERIALKQWLEAGAPKESYEKDAFALPEGMGAKLTKRFQTEAPELPKVVANGAPLKKKKNPKDRQLSVENLTQSTHAHLLTFSVLWAATGLVFAFTTYSMFIRCIVSPIVLIAQVADIGCWWLARLPDVGPYFALAIMGTGAVVGLGLGAQIVLSLFNMYGAKGKAVLVLLFLVAAAGGYVVYEKAIAPQIAEEKQAG